jgi:hypothetical protein
MSSYLRVSKAIEGSLPSTKKFAEPGRSLNPLSTKKFTEPRRSLDPRRKSSLSRERLATLDEKVH